ENAAQGHFKGRTEPARFRIPSNSRPSAATISQVTILVSSNGSPGTRLQPGVASPCLDLGNTLGLARPYRDAPTSFFSTYERHPEAPAALSRSHWPRPWRQLLPRTPAHRESARWELYVSECRPAFPGFVGASCFPNPGY